MINYLNIFPEPLFNTVFMASAVSFSSRSLYLELIKRDEMRCMLV